MSGFCDFYPHYPICLHLADALDIAQMRGRKFTPTNAYDLRPVGLSSRTRLTANPPHYDIFVEYGHSREETVLTLVHELGHVWQYQVQPENGKNFLQEGIACWLELAFMRHVTERPETVARESWLARAAKRSRDLTTRLDSYGRSYRNLVAQIGEDADLDTILVALGVTTRDSIANPTDALLPSP